MRLTLLLLAGLATLTLLITPTPSFAGSLSDPTGRNEQQVTLNSSPFRPLGNTSVQGIIGRIIQFVLGLTGVIALVMFIYGGFLWMTAAGSSSRVEQAKKTLVWSTLGIIAIFSAYALVNLVISALS